MRKLKVTRVMYNRQVVSSHTENALEVVRNINQADECKSCHHKTVSRINYYTLNIHNATASMADVTGN